MARQSNKNTAKTIATPEKKAENPELDDVAEQDKLAQSKAKPKRVYGYMKGDKDPTKYDVTDPLYGHVNGPRHLEWLSVNG